jgi:hypothetical protein
MLSQPPQPLYQGSLFHANSWKTSKKPQLPITFDRERSLELTQLLKFAKQRTTSTRHFANYVLSGKSRYWKISQGPNQSHSASLAFLLRRTALHLHRKFLFGWIEATSKEADIGQFKSYWSNFQESQSNQTASNLRSRVEFTSIIVNSA